MLIKFLLTHLLISDVSVFLGQKSIFEFWQILQSQNTVLQLPVFNENRPTLESENLHEAERNLQSAALHQDVATFKIRAAGQSQEQQEKKWSSYENKINVT